MSRIFIFGFLFFTIALSAQNTEVRITIPSVDVKSIDGSTISTDKIIANEGRYIILFWKSCCPINKILMDDISEMIDEYDLQDSLTVYAFCIDDTRSYNKARTLASSSDWPFQFYFDVNSDFKRAMSVLLTPSTLLIVNEKVILRTNGYDLGQVDDLIQNLN